MGDEPRGAAALAGGADEHTSVAHPHFDLNEVAVFRHFVVQWERFCYAKIYKSVVNGPDVN